MILFVALFLAGCFLFFSTADAAGIVPCGRNAGTAEEMQPCTLCHLFIGIHRIIEWGFKILTFVAVASLVGAGIMYIISAGNEKMMETAKNLTKHTLMGFAIVLGAWLIVNYSMILLSKQDDLGIGVTSWSEFNCDTSSDLGEEGSMSPSNSSRWLCVSAGNCRIDSNGSYSSEEECENSPTCSNDCGDYHTSCTNRPCCNSKHTCVQHPGLASGINWCVGEGEYCGAGNTGYCYDGTFYNPCPPDAFHVTGGADCSTGRYCCANHYQQTPTPDPTPDPNPDPTPTPTPNLSDIDYPSEINLETAVGTSAIASDHITNNGTTDLIFNSMHYDGVGIIELADVATEDNECVDLLIVHPGDSCSMMITYSPNSLMAEPHQGTITFNTNAGNLIIVVNGHRIE